MITYETIDKDTIKKVETKEEIFDLKALREELKGIDKELKDLDQEPDEILVINEEKQDPLASYKTQAIDDYTTTSVTYFCKMKPDGKWLFMKIDETGNFPTFTYANVSNNPTLTDYATAFAARTTATYESLNNLTL